MNRQALIAALTVAFAFAGAGSAFAVEATQDDAVAQSTSQRADVRREARLNVAETEVSAAPTASSAVNRAQVAAEAREAVRLGVAFGTEAGPRTATPEQLESIRLAGLRAVAGSNLASR